MYYTPAFINLRAILKILNQKMNFTELYWKKVKITSKIIEPILN